MPKQNKELTAQQKTMMKQINSVAEQFKEIDHEVREVVSYSQFKNTYLPLLAGEVEDSANQWVINTGHPHAFLYVMNDDDTVKYKIPPLLLPRFGAYAGEKGRSIIDQSSELPNAYATNPTKAVEDLFISLDRYSESVDAKEVISYIQYIDDILVEHGYPTIMTEDTKGKVSNTSVTDTVEYEDEEDIL